jgi:hypothetical protein
VDLINEQHIERFKVGEKPCKVAGESPTTYRERVMNPALASA